MNTDNTGSADTPVTASPGGVSTTTPETVTSAPDTTKLDSSVQDQGDKAGQTDQQGQSTEDSFFDPKNLPEELVPVYKGMQSAYTKKTQEIAEIRKNAEAWKVDAEQYAKYKTYIPIVEEMLSSKDANKQAVNPDLQALETKLKEEGYSDEAINMMKIGAQVILNQFDQKSQAAEGQRQLISKIAEAEQVDPRLNDESLTYQIKDGKSLSFGELVAQLVFAKQDWRNDPVTATKEAIETVDALIGQAKTDGKVELSNSAKAKGAKFPSVNSSPQSAASNSQPKTVHEAAEEAKKELDMN